MSTRFQKWISLLTFVEFAESIHHTLNTRPNHRGVGDHGAGFRWNLYIYVLLILLTNYTKLNNFFNHLSFLFIFQVQLPDSSH